MAKKLTANKAKEMLKDGTVHGKKLTAKQKRYFGYVAGGGTPKAQDGKKLSENDKQLYKIDRALQLGYTPDSTGHMDSRDYLTGEILKYPAHPTFWKAINADRDLGYTPMMDPKGNVYTISPKDLPKEGYFAPYSDNEKNFTNFTDYNSGDMKTRKKLKKGVGGFQLGKPSKVLNTDANQWMQNQIDVSGLSPIDKMRINPALTQGYQQQAFSTEIPQQSMWDATKPKQGMDWDNAFAKGIPVVSDLVKGFSQLKQEKKQLQKARQWNKVSEATLLASQTSPEESMRKYVRPEDQYLTGEELYPIYGTGTNVLAKSGIHIKPENRGKFTAYKKRTGKTTEEALHSKDPHVRQMANFARNAKKWKHEDGGEMQMMQPLEPSFNLPPQELLPMDNHIFNRVHSYKENGPTYYDEAMRLDSEIEKLNSNKKLSKVKKEGRLLELNQLKDDLLKHQVENLKDGGCLNCGGNLKKANLGQILTAFDQAGGTDKLSSYLTDITGENAGGSIGGTLGETAGSLIGGPVGGMIGKLAGQGIGSLIDRNPYKIEKQRNSMYRNINTAVVNDWANNRESSFMEDGGEMERMTPIEPQLIQYPTELMPMRSIYSNEQSFNNKGTTYLQEANRLDAEVAKIKANKKMSEMKKAGRLREIEQLKEDLFSDQMGNKMRTGGNIRQNAMDGDLQVYGGKAETISQNPFLPEGGETIMFKGPSHANGGIDVKYGEQGVNVEGEEPAVKLANEDLVVFGNITPDKQLLDLAGLSKYKGKGKFKNIVKGISDEENKINKRLDKAMKALDGLNVTTPHEKLEFSSYKAIALGSNMGLKAKAEDKQKLADLQKAINDYKEETGKTAKNGISMAKDGETVTNDPYFVAGIDISPWATSKSHEENVKKYYKNIRDKIFEGESHPALLANRINSYIQGYNKKSPLVGMGEKIVELSLKYHVDPALTLAIMQADSSMGTNGKGARTNNPGNYRNDDSGNLYSFNSWEEGIEAIPKQLSMYRDGTSKHGTPSAKGYGVWDIPLLAYPNNEDRTPSTNDITQAIIDMQPKVDLPKPIQPTTVTPSMPSVNIPGYQPPSPPDYVINEDYPLQDLRITPPAGTPNRKSLDNLAKNEQWMEDEAERQLGRSPYLSYIPPITPINESSSNQVTPINDKYAKYSMIAQMLPYLRPSDAEELDPLQIADAMFALSQNQLEPVQAQTYQPDLGTPYDISLQDQLNANQADYSTVKRTLGYNPAALSVLNAQKYKANSNVLGEQFRLNQAMKDKVYGENRNTLNQAKLQNLGILDNQYVRQAQAKSNTKDVKQNALNSISSKYLQNKLENRTLQTYENLYNYRYDDKGRAINMNAPAQFAMSGNGNTQGNRLPDGYEYTYRLDDNGNMIPDDIKKKTKSTTMGANGTILKAFKTY